MADQRTPRERDALKRLGMRVRLARVERGWSQESLAYSAGLHRTHVGTFERGEANITVLNLLRIAAALEVDAATLLDGIERAAS
jgi:transcriptional regulator with XRE-family HTH domain